MPLARWLKQSVGVTLSQSVRLTVLLNKNSGWEEEPLLCKHPVGVTLSQSVRLTVLLNKSSGWEGGLTPLLCKQPVCGRLRWRPVRSSECPLLAGIIEIF
jgi:hypothetical protein